MKILYKLLIVVLALIGELVVLEIGSEILFGNSHGEMVDVSFVVTSVLQHFLIITIIRRQLPRLHSTRRCD